MEQRVSRRAIRRTLFRDRSSPWTALDPDGSWVLLPGSASANGAAEADHVSVGVGDRALPLAIVLVPRALDFDPRLSPLIEPPGRLPDSGCRENRDPEVRRLQPRRGGS